VLLLLLVLLMLLSLKNVVVAAAASVGISSFPVRTSAGVDPRMAEGQAVVVRNADGTLLADLPHGGFITVIQNAMARERLTHGIEGNPPMNIVRYANGRLVAEDPATGWSAELYAFGGENKAAFERLLEQ
jgi:putative photosynthetic complex assembly protein